MADDVPAAGTVRRDGTGWLAAVDPAGAAWVEQAVAAPAATPAVVVVGETKRGKSSLVNALLASEGLSRADAAEPTACYLVLRHGPEPRATAHRPGAPPVEVPFADREAACRDAGPTGAPPPRWMELEVPVPLLRRLTLVDTPGVGGLTEVHGELAREAAASATAVLFVLDAAAPIGRGELAFLTTLAERVETVLFALTKIDQHRDWRAVLDADRALLAAHVPRFATATVHPVSARLFERAASADATLAPVLRGRSGIAELQLALQQQVARRGRVLAEANALRALHTALEAAGAGLRARQRALEAGTGHAAALRQRRIELEAARRSADRGWQLRLRAEIQRTRLAATHQVAERVRATQTRLRDALRTASRAEHGRLPNQVDAALRLLAGQVSADLAAATTRITDAGLADLFTPDEIDAVRRDLVRHAESPPVPPPATRPRSSEDTLLVAVGFSGGLGIGRLAALPLAELGVGGAAALVAPASIVLGLGAGWWMARTRRQAADTAHLELWLADVLAQARAALDRAVGEQFVDVEQRVAVLLDQALAGRIAGIECELREVDRAVRLDRATRLAGVERLSAQLAEADALRTRVAGALARLQGRSADPP